MYRLTIDQASDVMPYIVTDAETLSELTDYLEDYKRKLTNPDIFISYDIIEVKEILEYSSTLEDVTFPELRKEGYV